jgi:hypothetical protein
MIRDGASVCPLAVTFHSLPLTSVADRERLAADAVDPTTSPGAKAQARTNAENLER